jgi:hypothetical protein
VYASWNGATGVSGWRVLAGASAGSLKAVKTARSAGFETAIRFHGRQPFEAVQALASNGRVLSTSPAVRRK